MRMLPLLGSVMGKCKDNAIFQCKLPPFPIQPQWLPVNSDKLVIHIKADNQWSSPAIWWWCSPATVGNITARCQATGTSWQEKGVAGALWSLLGLQGARPGPFQAAPRGLASAGQTRGTASWVFYLWSVFSTPPEGRLDLMYGEALESDHWIIQTESWVQCFGVGGRWDGLNSFF